MDLREKERMLELGMRRRKAWWRSRRLWALGLTLLAVAALAAIAITREGAQDAQEQVVEGPPPFVSASGAVVPEKRARLSFTTIGRVRTLFVQAGDQVRQGQPLARLEPSTSPSGIGSPEEASQPYIVAPFDGTVGLVPVREWETVNPGDPVVVVGDMSTLRVEIEDLSENDVGRLAGGQPVDLTFEAFPGRKVQGRVTSISPMNNGKGGGVNYDVVVEFVTRDLPQIRWGMTVHADIHVEEGR